MRVSRELQQSAAVFIFLALSSLPAKADGITVYGTNAAIDTTTGFVWLQLTQTLNMSFDEISAQLAPGGKFAGYTYATVDEVEHFWADAGLTGPSLGCPEVGCLAARGKSPDFVSKHVTSEMFQTS